MSDRSLVLKTFNKHFFDFLDDLVALFPEMIDIKESRDYFDILKRANPTLLIKIWYSFIHVPYSDVIEKGDITFFFKKDYSTDLIHLHNAADIIKVIDTTLREPLQNMDEVNLEKCVKYIQILSKLCDAFNNI
jgi:hypothetical protein